MPTSRRLALRREHLTALAATELERAAAAGPPHTLLECLTDTCPTDLANTCTHCASIAAGICPPPE